MPRRIGSYRKNSRRVYRKRSYNKRKRTTFPSRVKRVITRSAETKYYDAQAENVQLYHNVGPSVGFPGAVYPYAFYMNPLGLQQGAVQGSRVGDKVHSMGLRLRLWLSTKSDRTNVMYRVLVIQYPELDVGGLSAFIGVNQKFFNSTGNSMLQTVNTENFSVVLDRLIQPVQQSGGGEEEREHSLFRQYFIRTNRVITYTDNTADTSTTKPKSQRNRFAMYVIPYDAWGTLVTDNIASLAYHFRHTYKDL